MPGVFPDTDIPVIGDRAAVTRFPAGHAVEDGNLVRSARAGDESAFTRLYERYGRVVHALLLARVTAQDVEDLVQDVFLTAWRRLDDLRDPAAFGGWIAMIARNRATDAHRRAAEFVELPADLESPGAASARGRGQRRARGDPRAARRVPRDARAAARRRADRTGDRRANGTDAGVGQGEPASRHEDAARETGRR